MQHRSPFAKYAGWYTRRLRRHLHEAMPTVEVDVDNIPDIIEAQLTLSYSRLTDLIRVIIDQGNGHEDDIQELRDRLDHLEAENASLKTEVNQLKSTKENSGSLESQVADLAAEVAKLAGDLAQSKSDAADQAAASQAAATAAEETVNALGKAMQDLDKRLTEVYSRVQVVESSSALSRAFTELWGGKPEVILAMGGRDGKDSADFEHSIEARTKYLHTLPAFTAMYEEVGVVRGLVQKQAAESLAAKTSESSRNSRSGSDTAGLRNPFSATQQELQDVVRNLGEIQRRLGAVENERLPPLEQACGSGTGGDDMQQLQERLAALEERLRALFEPDTTGPTADAKDGGDHDNSIDRAALFALGGRVSALEEVVEGLPRRGAPGRLSEVVLTGQGAESASVDLSGSHLAGSTGGSGGGGGGGAGASRSGSGRSALPPLSPSPAGSTTNKDVPSPPRLTSTTEPQRSSSLSTGTPNKQRQVEQPVLETLRRQEAATPTASGRRISVVMEADDGLRKRVAQLEENVAILEVNKADRRELALLEATLRASNTAALPAAPSMVPHRPASAVVSMPGTHVSGRGASPGPVGSRPGSSFTGRPVFVANGSINLRDGAQLTNATISSSYMTAP